MKDVNTMDLGEHSRKRGRKSRGPGVGGAWHASAQQRTPRVPW